MLAALFRSMGFELAKSCSIGFEIGTVGAQAAQLGAGSFDSLSDAGDLGAGKIVHHHNNVESQASHAPARKNTRWIDFIALQGGDECHCLPMAPGYRGDEALTTRAAAIATRVVGCRTRFVDEDQAFAILGDIQPILLSGSLRFF